jgi:hypothetical protein
VEFTDNLGPAMHCFLKKHQELDTNLIVTFFFFFSSFVSSSSLFLRFLILFLLGPGG